MHSTCVSVVLLGIFALVQGGFLPRRIVVGSCYPLESLADFDYTQFSNGEWNEISRIQNDFEGAADCVVQTYNASGRGEFDMNFEMRFSNGSLGSIMAPVTYNITEDGIFMEAVFPQLSKPAAYDIYATDYSNYAIIYACLQEEVDPFPIKNELLWVIGREKALTPDIQAIVDDDISKIGDGTISSALKPVNQNCA